LLPDVHGTHSGLNGEPITDVLSMAGISDRYRRFVLDGVPVATGIISVGDSWACTNPSLGRGITLGLLHHSARQRWFKNTWITHLDSRSHMTP
jgi:hypothetical protein